MPFNKETYAKNYREGNRIRGEKIVRKCLRCGEEITDYVSQTERKYCSRECKWEAERTAVDHPCDFCGKMVSVEPARLKWSKVRGRGKIFCNKECQWKGNSGEGSPLWIEDRTKLSDRRHTERNSLNYIQWRTSVFERDKYTCQKCGKVGGYLHVHHVKEWEYYPELRYEVSNGMTLCRRPCHKEIHDARRTNRKVSDEQVGEIKEMRESGATLREIGKKYKVTESTVSMICSGKKRTTQYTQS
jgi:5-methylcytosine-specific restriction endonuclease McrA